MAKVKKTKELVKLYNPFYKWNVSAPTPKPKTKLGHEAGVIDWILAQPAVEPKALQGIADLDQIEKDIQAHKIQPLSTTEKKAAVSLGLKLPQEKHVKAMKYLDRLEYAIRSLIGPKKMFGEFRLSYKVKGGHGKPNVAFAVSSHKTGVTKDDSVYDMQIRLVRALLKAKKWWDLNAKNYIHYMSETEKDNSRKIFWLNYVREPEYGVNYTVIGHKHTSTLCLGFRKPSKDVLSFILETEQERENDDDG